MLVEGIKKQEFFSINNPQKFEFVAFDMERQMGNTWTLYWHILVLISELIPELIYPQFSIAKSSGMTPSSTSLWSHTSIFLIFIFYQSLSKIKFINAKSLLVKIISQQINDGQSDNSSTL